MAQKGVRKFIFDLPPTKRMWLGIGELNVHEIADTKTMMELPCDLVQLQCENSAFWTE